VPICTAGTFSIGIAAGGRVRVASLSELVALARREPGRYLWSATGGLPELVFRAFLELERLEIKHVAYRDVTSAVHDLNAGRIDLLIAAVPTLSPALQRGSARLLAVMNSARAAAPSDVPTAAAAGYPMLTVDGGLGVFGWRGMPEDLRQRIAADIRHAAGDPAIVAKLATMGFVVSVGTPEHFVEVVDRQSRQVAEIARIVGLKRPGEGTSDVRLR